MVRSSPPIDWAGPLSVTVRYGVCTSISMSRSDSGPAGRSSVGRSSTAASVAAPSPAASRRSSSMLAVFAASSKRPVRLSVTFSLAYPSPPSTGRRAKASIVSPPPSVPAALSSSNSPSSVPAAS